MRVTRRSWRSRRGSRASALLDFGRDLALVADRFQADRDGRALTSPSIAASNAGDVARSRPCRDSRACRRRSTTTCSSTGIGENCGCFSSFGQARAARQEPLGRGVEIGGELRERRHLAILRELELDAPGDLLHRLDLRRRADAADRQPDIDRRADAAIEQLGLEEDLAVGDRDHVGRDIGRHVAGLGLDDRQRGQRAGAVILVHLGGALEQPRMQIEHVARDRPRGPAGGAAAATSGDRRRPASTDRHRRSARACRCRGRTRPWHSRHRAPEIAAAPAPTRWRRPRSSIRARRNPAAS